MGTMTQWFSLKPGYPIKIVNKSAIVGASMPANFCEGPAGPNR
jgi:hypothetical protein